jgi:hypothetical protein
MSRRIGLSVPQGVIERAAELLAWRLGAGRTVAAATLPARSEENRVR